MWGYKDNAGDSLSLVKAFLFSLGVSSGDIFLFQRERDHESRTTDLSQGFHWREADFQLPLWLNE
jgi:hypothetical protein